MLIAVLRRVTPQRVKRLLRLVQRFISLSRTEQWLLLRAYVWLTAVSIGLRVLGFKRLMAFIGDGATAGEPLTNPHANTTEHPVSGHEMRQAVTYARLINAASHRHFVHGQCLHRSLVLHLWLHKEHIASEFVIGVRKSNDELKAHAWVTVSGICISDPGEPTDQFKPLTTVSGAFPRWLSVPSNFTG